MTFSLKYIFYGQNFILLGVDLLIFMLSFKVGVVNLGTIQYLIIPLIILALLGVYSDILRISIKKLILKIFICLLIAATYISYVEGVDLYARYLAIFIGLSSYRLALYLFLKKNKQLQLAIIGVNENTASIVSDLNRNDNVVCIFSSNTEFIGRKINSVLVEDIKKIKNIVEDYSVSNLIVAMHESDCQEIEEIELLSELNLDIKMAKKRGGTLFYSSINNDNDRLEDVLLKRRPIVHGEEMKSVYQNQNILITGGGGSIGSALVKRILEFNPAELHIIDHNEYSLYTIEMYALSRIKELNLKTKLIISLSNLCNEFQVSSHFEQHHIDCIFHAAAYKHVPMLEACPIDGVYNNIESTYNLVCVAEKFKIKNFVLISSDKAVRAPNIMGATKRFSEQIVQSFSITGEIIYSIVRFGNVLRSSGSVVNHFDSQIKSGGPLTLTHKNITRYFMSIKEAVSLILEANSLSVSNNESGIVYVLDMGNPIRIYDLAVAMIRLAGKRIARRPGEFGAIYIDEVGLRPGEKLNEELFFSKENVINCKEKIYMAKESSHSKEQILKYINLMRAAVKYGDVQGIRKILVESNSLFQEATN